jgi:predicted transcriptional regulator
MALAPIDDEHVVKDHPAAEPVLTPHTAVHVARARLVATGEPAAVVFQQGRPVGVVTADALAEPGTTSQQDAPVSTVMDYVAVHVTPGARTQETVRAFSDAAWDWLKLCRTTNRVRRLC